MDLLSTIRKSGSRGGVNFSWDDVASSSHRENYLGHSLKAPVGRWAKGRELDWYAKADSKPADSTETETDAERHARERADELRRIREAEEDAMARALGLPVKVRDSTGANAVAVEPTRQMGPESGPPRGEGERGDKAERARDRDRDRERERGHRRRERSRDRAGGRDRERSRERSRDRAGGREERRPRRDGARDRDRDRDRSRSADRRDWRRRDRERSRERYRSRSRDRRRRSPDGRVRR